jgi:hypothetical protein
MSGHKRRTISAAHTFAGATGPTAAAWGGAARVKARRRVETEQRTFQPPDPTDSDRRCAHNRTRITALRRRQPHNSLPLRCQPRRNSPGFVKVRWRFHHHTFKTRAGRWTVSAAFVLCTALPAGRAVAACNGGVTVSNSSGSGRNGDPISVLSTSTSATLINNGNIYTAAQWAITNTDTLGTLIKAGTICSGVRRHHDGRQLRARQHRRHDQSGIRRPHAGHQRRTADHPGVRPLRVGHGSTGHPLRIWPAAGQRLGARRRGRLRPEFEWQHAQRSARHRRGPRRERHPRLRRAGQPGHRPHSRCRIWPRHPLCPPDLAARSPILVQ